MTAIYKRHEDWYITYMEELSGVNVQEEARENLLGSRAAYHRK
jgi:hypothetical protein